MRTKGVKVEGGLPLPVFNSNIGREEKMDFQISFHQGVKEPKMDKSKL